MVTVGRWESTRSPTGSSRTQWAAFAAQVGDMKSAKVFRAAAMPSVDTFQAYKLAQAAAKALEQIRVAARRNRAVHAEYIKVLHALLRAHQVLTYQAIEGLKGKSDFYADLGFLAEAQNNLREELNEQTKQKTKTKR